MKTYNNLWEKFITKENFELAYINSIKRKSKQQSVREFKKNKEENWVEEISLKEAMDRLSDRENNIIKLRFFQGKTQMEVADEIHISQAQVSRLEKSALKNMKNYLSEK